MRLGQYDGGMNGAGKGRQEGDGEHPSLPTSGLPVSGGFTGGGALLQPEPRPWKPFAAAGVLVLVVVAGLLLMGRNGRDAGSSVANPGGAGLAQPAAYAGFLPISDLQMSDSSNLSGGKETYLDGVVRNTGSSVVGTITVQIAFKDVTGMLAGKETLPLTLIRFREPYVDTEPVSAEPIRPGESRPFRLIFDAAPQTWDGAYPEVRVIAVGTR